jgi:hypothetical protein
MLCAEDEGGSGQALHSGDPDMMHFSRSLLRFECLAPSPAIQTSMRPMSNISPSESNSATIINLKELAIVSFIKYIILV